MGHESQNTDALQSPVRWTPVAVFLLTVGVILYSGRNFFFAGYPIPVSDFAANDILIIDAKNFALWHGNYSRVGFYHPGPFFLQIMAFSEFIFYDLLRAFSSPFSAQVFGVVLFTGFVAAYCTRVFTQVFRSVGLSLVGSTALCFLVLHSGALVVASPWMPFFYVLTATALALSSLSLMSGRLTSLPIFFAAMGALVHGHASFLGIVPVIATVLVLGMVAKFGLKRKWQLPDNRTLVCSLLVCFFFAFPVFVQIFVDWPGEFGKYLEFAGSSSTHPTTAAAGYVLSLFPNWQYLLPIAALALFVRAPFRFDLVASSWIVFAAGFAGALYYARSGVDDFNYKYLEFWAVPFYAQLIATVACVLIGPLLERIPRFAFAAGPAAAIVLAAYVYHGTGLTAFPMNDGGRFEQAVSHIDPRLGASISIDKAYWDDGWGESVALIALAKRRGLGSNALCIDPESWHLLFSEAYRCSTDRKTHLLATGSAHADAATWFQGFNIRFYEDKGALLPSLSTTPNSRVMSSPLLASDVNVKLSLVEPPKREGDNVLFSVRVENDGITYLSGLGRYPVRLALVNLKGNERIELGRHNLSTIEPGESSVMEVSAPYNQLQSGKLRFELLQEDVAWFSINFGQPPLDILLPSL